MAVREGRAESHEHCGRGVNQVLRPRGIRTSVPHVIHISKEVCLTSFSGSVDRMGSLGSQAGVLGWSWRVSDGDAGGDCM